MSQSNNHFYQKKQKRNSELLFEIISGYSKYVKTTKNFSEIFANFEENSKSISKFEINKQRIKLQKFEELELVIVIELPAVTVSRFEIIEPAAIPL
ncbi:981_t:CDS:1, partial [Diversispora eburnea]